MTFKVKARPDARGASPRLTPGKVYDVVEIDCEYYRVISDDGDPYLYPKSLFETHAGGIPADWIMLKFPVDDDDPDDGRTWAPREFAEQHFFERYFDREPKHIAIYEAYRRRLR